MNILRKTALAALLCASALPAMAQGIPAIIIAPGLPTNPTIFPQGDATTGIYSGTNRLGIAGHIESGVKFSGNVPVVTACGTTPTLVVGSTDSAGTIIMGTSATGCVITFGTAYAVAPSCVVTWIATPLASQSYAVTTTAITTVQTSATNNILDYFCVAKSGG